MEWREQVWPAKGWGTLTGPQENTGVQKAVSDGGRVVATQEALDPTTPRAELTVAVNPRLKNLRLAGVVGAWRYEAEPGQPTPPGEEAFPSVVARNPSVSPEAPISDLPPLFLRQTISL